MARLPHNVRKSRHALSAQDVIVRPHVTEKATDVAADSVYTFIVADRADKIQVAKAVEELFKVKPIKVNIVNKQTSTRVVRGRGSRKTKGFKKAMVYLTPGDKIEFV